METKNTLLIPLVSLAIGLLGGISISKLEFETREIIPTNDLNRDGYSDVIIKNVFGFKTPMYGIVDKNGLRYITSEEINREYTAAKQGSKIIRRYRGIEKDLNKQSP